MLKTNKRFVITYQDFSETNILLLKKELALERAFLMHKLCKEDIFLNNLKEIWAFLDSKFLLLICTHIYQHQFFPSIV